MLYSEMIEDIENVLPSCDISEKGMHCARKMTSTISKQRLIINLLITTSILVQLTGCFRPYIYTPPEKVVTPVLTIDFAVMEDGYRLPLISMSGNGDLPRAVVLALHGFNDYSRSFSELGTYLAGKNISLIAYDQRGFGGTTGSGYWHGESALVDDLLTLVRLVGQQYSDVPLYVLGESMGGAVILASLQSLQEQVGYHGLILVAPAVWAKATMPWYLRFSMWLTAHLFPWLKVSGEGLSITPSDNNEMLQALGRDPLVIKKTRTDALYGLSNLMDTALESSISLKSPTLILYGKHDEIITREPTCAMLKKLMRQEDKRWKLIVYEDGYHMLTRDLQAQKVFSDIETWISEGLSKDGSLPTGALKEDIEFICD